MIEWLKISNELPAHPKTHRLARSLKLEEAGWYVVKLFAWCSRYNHRGVFKGADAAAEIELAAGWSKKAGAFYEAALAVGFLDALPDGTVEVHDWWDWNGDAITRAEEEARKKREKREQQRLNGAESASSRRKNGSRAAIADPPPRRQQRQLPRDGTAHPDDDDETESKKTEPENKRPPQPPHAGAQATRARAAGGTSDPSDRVTGVELVDFWNAVPRPPALLPMWEVLTPEQLEVAEVLALEFGRAQWATFFELLGRRAFLNGCGDRGWIVSPKDLLEKGSEFVVAVLNGSYANRGDLPARQAQTAGAA